MAINGMRYLFVGGVQAIYSAEQMQLEAYP